MLANLSPSRLAALMPATESDGDLREKFRLHQHNELDGFLGSLEVVSCLLQRADGETVQTDGVPSAMPLASSMCIIGSRSAGRIRAAGEQEDENGENQEGKEPRIPTFNCDQRTFFDHMI